MYGGAEGNRHRRSSKEEWRDFHSFRCLGSGKVSSNGRHTSSFEVVAFWRVNRTAPPTSGILTGVRTIQPEPKPLVELLRSTSIPQTPRIGRLYLKQMKQVGIIGTTKTRPGRPNALALNPPATVVSGGKPQWARGVCAERLFGNQTRRPSKYRQISAGFGRRAETSCSGSGP